MDILTTDRPSAREIREGQVIYAGAITAANILRDIREHITNTFGGRMRRYEEVLDETLARAMTDIAQKAAAAGYDGIVGLRIVHPKIADGAIEVVVYGTGFNYTDSGRPDRV